MNSQSRGQIKLKSADPKDSPSVDPKYLSHPYDVVNLREALREGLKLMQTSTMKEHFVRPIFAPKSDSDEDIVVSCDARRLDSARQLKTSRNSSSKTSLACGTLHVV